MKHEIKIQKDISKKNHVVMDLHADERGDLS
jgi:hypothetical protein